MVRRRPLSTLRKGLQERLARPGEKGSCRGQGRRAYLWRRPESERAGKALWLLGLFIGGGVLLQANGCRRQAPQLLVIRGGPSVEGLFAALIAAYQQQYPKVRIRSDFTCPPCRIITSGNMPADFDLFVSLGDFELKMLERHTSFMPAKTQALGRTRLVIATSRRVQSPVRSVADLHKASFRRLGVGDPDKVGVGYYTRQALQKMGLWEELRPRLAYSESGCELLQWLGLGRNVDAAVIFQLCVDEVTGAVRDIFVLPAEVAPPVPVLLSRSAHTAHTEEAERFMAFAAQAHEILRRYHLEPVGTTAETQ